MTKKQIIRQLKKYANLNCKEQTYQALEKFGSPRRDENGEWRTGIIVQVKVNHARRVKKVYKKWGIRAAMIYLNVFKKEEPKEA